MLRKFRVWTTDFHALFYQFSERVHRLQMSTTPYLIVNVCSPIFKQSNPFVMNASCWQIFCHTKFYYNKHFAFHTVLYSSAYFENYYRKTNCSKTFPLALLAKYWNTENVPQRTNRRSIAAMPTIFCILQIHRLFCERPS